MQKVENVEARLRYGQIPRQVSADCLTHRKYSVNTCWMDGRTDGWING